MKVSLPATQKWLELNFQASDPKKLCTCDHSRRFVLLDSSRGRLPFVKMNTMAPTTNLTVDEYDRIYGHESGWEFWFGEVHSKPMPTYIHGLLQILLAELLRLAGYISTVETELRIVEDWRPRPDVCGVLEEVEGRYPTEPVDVAFEIISEDEDIVPKCQHYSQLGITQVFVFYPEGKTISLWEGQRLKPVTDVELANGVTITGATVWAQMERRRHREPPKSMKI